MLSYLILRTPIYTEVGVVSGLLRYRLRRPPDDLNILRWVLIRSAVTVLRYRMLIAITAKCNLKLKQYNITNAFVYTTIN